MVNLANRRIGLGGRMGYVIRDLFACIEIAEEEIEKAKCEHPDRADELHGAFRYLTPGDGLRGKVDYLYRHHVQEILWRVVASEDLSPGTVAEVCAVLSDTSLRAPLVQDAAYLYARTFKAVFGSLPPDVVEPTESYPGASGELLARMVKRLSRDRDCKNNGGGA